MKKLGIYIHIPFCLAKCKYCGFFSNKASEKEQDDYIDKLIEDMDEYGKTYGDRYTVDSVFIGGGTPSILNPEQVERVFESLKKNFVLEKDPEITIEANPKTLTKEKLTAYKKAGVNRLSIGLQSFDDSVLEILGRAHRAEDFLESYNLARTCGFDNINVDLMFGVPGHSMKVWEDTLEKVVELGPEHISFYSLQIEEGTLFYDMFMSGELEQIDEYTDRAMYHRAVGLLKEAGYCHYEISNCSKNGFQCRHNLKYWSFDEYLGIGQAASSFIEGIRFTEAPYMDYHVNTLEDDMSEFTFTGLRKTCGLDMKEFSHRFGREFWQVYGEQKNSLADFFRQGFLIEEGSILRLSEEGIDISNTIMAEFV